MSEKDIKMANGNVWSGAFFQKLPKSKGNISEYVCKRCSAYETQLKEALDEHESARMIIDILQKELLTSTTTKNMCGKDSISIQSLGKQSNTKEWTLVS